MDLSGMFSPRYMRLGLLVTGALLGGCGGSSRGGPVVTTAPGGASAQAIAPLSADDVSILFPAPTSAADLAHLIAVSDLTAPNPQDPSKRDPVWSDAVFQQFLGLAASSFAQVSGTETRIGLPAEAQLKANWFV